MSDIWRRIQEVRPGISRRELARMTGLSHATVITLGSVATVQGGRGRGKAGPHIETIRVLAQALQVDPGWLAFGGGGR